jgi:hypothetical protein
LLLLQPEFVTLNVIGIGVGVGEGAGVGQQLVKIVVPVTKLPSVGFVVVYVVT